VALVARLRHKWYGLIEESARDMGGLSIWHLLVVLVVAMLLFGAGRVSEMGKGLGEGIRNFKKGLREEDEDRAKRKTEDEDEEVEVQVVKVPKKLPPPAPEVVDPPKKKRVIQIEVDEDADEEEIARRVAAKKKALAGEDEKAT
jgi:sec-independent protein translocase protein TatA